MRASKLVCWLVAGSSLAAASLPAVAVAAEEPGGRYTMSPADGGGFVRLDRLTGAMALCTRKDDKWSCEDMHDSQRTLMSEVDKLRADNKSLKDQVEQLEETLGIGENQTDAPKPRAQLTLPTEQDVDKAFDYLEGIVKKLRERMQRLEAEQQKDGKAL
jgi:hypothetical protein